MAVYECSECGMSIGTMTCGKCSKDLVHDTIDVEGATIHVSKCPDGHGMVKSPQCCAKDMTCQVPQG